MLKYSQTPIMENDVNDSFSLAIPVERTKLERKVNKTMTLSAYQDSHFYHKVCFIFPNSALTKKKYAAIHDLEEILRKTNDTNHVQKKLL